MTLDRLMSYLTAPLIIIALLGGYCWGYVQAESSLIQAREDDSKIANRLAERLIYAELFESMWRRCADLEPGDQQNTTIIAFLGEKLAALCASDVNSSADSISTTLQANLPYSNAGIQLRQHLGRLKTGQFLKPGPAPDADMPDDPAPMLPAAP